MFFVSKRRRRDEKTLFFFYYLLFTQMAALGVDRDYIEYMMGHTISTYHDIKMKGIEFLRGVYISSGMSIRPKTAVSKIDALKEIIRAWALNPEDPNPRSPTSTTQNSDRPQPTGTNPTCTTRKRFATGNAQRNPRKYSAKQYTGMQRAK
jgi:hypothetical protein